MAVEDIDQCKAYAVVSEDVIAGTDQTMTPYWGRDLLPFLSATEVDKISIYK